MFTSPFIYAATWERKDKLGLERKPCAARNWTHSLRIQKDFERYCECFGVH